MTLKCKSSIYTVVHDGVRWTVSWNRTEIGNWLVTITSELRPRYIYDHTIICTAGKSINPTWTKTRYYLKRAIASSKYERGVYS